MENYTSTTQPVVDRTAESFVSIKRCFHLFLQTSETRHTAFRCFANCQKPQKENNRLLIPEAVWNFFHLSSLCKILSCLSFFLVVGVCREDHSLPFFHGTKSVLLKNQLCVYNIMTSSAIPTLCTGNPRSGHLFSSFLQLILPS